ncbi:MAG: VPLPA-CTERM sorting domain-containing protein [Gammaproteobacteria bacterium]|nr:MAG: VPLPA-CTERM sorting domain-containing protein [Gammaproteobacteria bacterium]
MKRYLGGIVLALWCCGSVQAALLSRLGGQAVYDTDRNITWLANANLAASNTFGVTGIAVNGTMTWAKANEWIAAMNTANYLGVHDWRLPTTLQPDPSCHYQSGGGSYGVSCTGSEMGHLFYGELGGVGSQSIVTTHNANYSLFSNVQPSNYWSGTVYAPAPGSFAWDINFGYGDQNYNLQVYAFHAWAVRPGDIVPVPAAVWLFGSAMGVFAMVRRRVLAGAGA